MNDRLDHLKALSDRISHAVSDMKSALAENSGLGDEIIDRHLTEMMILASKVEDEIGMDICEEFTKLDAQIDPDS